MASLPNPRQEADLLVSHVIKANRLQLYLNPEDIVSASSYEKAQKLFEQRAAGVPTQYLLGIQEFWGLEFVVTPDVLIPRPETEVLVEEVLRLVKDQPVSGSRPIVDLGTGSGCIAITLAKSLPGVQMMATDISRNALTIARGNARRLGVHRQCTFVHGNLLEFLAKRDGNRVNMIISNPPYIPSDELETLAAEVKDHEPRLALDGGPDGLDLCRRIIQESPDRLVPGGTLIMEIGWKQSRTLSEWINHQDLPWEFEFKKDLAGIERVIILRKR
jgi:release factor glutamine methyltransferase